MIIEVKGKRVGYDTIVVMKYDKDKEYTRQGKIIGRTEEKGTGILFGLNISFDETKYQKGAYLHYTVAEFRELFVDSLDK